MHIFNLGSGKGYTVLEVIAAFGKACGKVGQNLKYIGCKDSESCSKADGSYRYSIDKEIC